MKKNFRAMSLDIIFIVCSFLSPCFLMLSIWSFILFISCYLFVFVFKHIVYLESAENINLSCDVGLKFSIAVYQCIDYPV